MPHGAAMAHLYGQGMVSNRRHTQPTTWTLICIFNLNLILFNYFT
jgi:hypothetical protein